MYKRRVPEGFVELLLSQFQSVNQLFPRAWSRAGMPSETLDINYQFTRSISRSDDLDFKRPKVRFMTVAYCQSQRIRAERQNVCRNDSRTELVICSLVEPGKRQRIIIRVGGE